MARFGRHPQARIGDSDGAPVVITPRYPGLRRRFASITRRAGAVVVVSGIAWWLFADTYARHVPSWMDKSEIRFAHFGSYEDYALWRGVISDFEHRHPGIRVHQEYVVGLGGRYNTKMRQQILSHTLPDVALIQLGPFHDLAEHFADLTPLLRSPVGENTELAASLDGLALKAFQVHGRQRALPVSGGNLLVFGNRECFTRASQFRGVPIPIPEDDWNIDDFRQIAELLTCDFDGDGRSDQFGFWLPRWIYYLPFLWLFGAELTDDRMAEWTLYGTEAEAALSFYQDLAVTDHVSPREDEVPQMFQDVGFLTGKVAMCINGPWFLPFLAKTRLADSYFVAPIPTGPAGRVTRITWDGAVMASRLPPRRRQAARRFMQFLVSQHTQDAIGQTGRAIPARRASQRSFTDTANDPRRARFIEALDYSRLQPLLPHFSQVDRAINKHLLDLLTPGPNSRPEIVLAELQADPAIRRAFALHVIEDPDR